MLKTKPKSSSPNEVTTKEVWFCIRVELHDCPCGQFSSEFVTVQHMIVVWPSEEDPVLKKTLAQSNEGEIVEYEEMFGPCVSWYEVEGSKLRGHIRREL